MVNHGLIAGEEQALLRTVSCVGYVLIVSSVVITIALWSRTCSLGGFHCFDGGYGLAVAVAQWGVVIGLVCSLFGRGMTRPLFAAIAIIDLACCCRQLLVH